MKFIASLLTLGFLLNIISAQISFFDQRFPPAPASRRTIVIRAGQLSGRRSAALIQKPEQKQEQQLSQQQDDSAQEQDLQEPIEQSTQRPQRNGVIPQQIASRPVNGFPRVPPTQQLDQTQVRTEEEEEVSQRQDSGLTDISMEDVSTERITPSVTLTSSEEVFDDGFAPTQPEQKPIVTTAISTQRKNGNGRQRRPNGNGRKSLVPSAEKPLVGNGRKPSNGRDRKPVTQIVDGGDAQVIDGPVIDAQVPDGQVSGGQFTDEQISDQRGVGRQPTQDVSGIPHEGGDHSDHHSGDPIQWLKDAIRGEPEADYPIFYTPPETSFKCSDQQFPGYYADVEARCQVFHICQDNGRSDAFLCPNGTIFSQQNFVCVWWHDFDCSTAPQLYSLNAQLYSQTSASRETQPLEGTGVQTPDFGGEVPSTDVVGTGPETPIDDRIVDGQQPIESQEPDLPQTFQTEAPSLPNIVDDSQEVISDETPAQEIVTTSAPINGLRSPNGRPIGGLKGGRRNGIRNGLGTNGSSAKRNGQNGGQQRVSVTTTRPISGIKRNGAPKRNGISSQPSVPLSPADNARNGLKKSIKTNGANGVQRKRPNGSTKTVFRDRTIQKQELDGQSSNWYYNTGL